MPRFLSWEKVSDKLTAVDAATAEAATEEMEVQRAGFNSRTAGVRRSPAAAGEEVADREDGNPWEETAITVHVETVRAVRGFI